MFPSCCHFFDWCWCSIWEDFSISCFWPTQPSSCPRSHVRTKPMPYAPFVYAKTCQTMGYWVWKIFCRITLVLQSKHVMVHHDHQSSTYFMDCIHGHSSKCSIWLWEVEHWQIMGVWVGLGKLKSLGAGHLDWSIPMKLLASVQVLYCHTL